MSGLLRTVLPVLEQLPFLPVDLLLLVPERLRLPVGLPLRLPDHQLAVLDGTRESLLLLHESALVLGLLVPDLPGVFLLFVDEQPVLLLTDLSQQHLQFAVGLLDAVQLERLRPDLVVELLHLHACLLVPEVFQTHVAAPTLLVPGQRFQLLLPQTQLLFGQALGQFVLLTQVF